MNTSGNFFQTLSELFHTHRVDEQLTQIDNKALRFKPVSGQGFPIADIQSIEHSSEEITVFCLFGGFYGVDSPLPTYFNECSQGDDLDAQAFRSFLDIFNHRMYALYFMAMQAFVPEYLSSNRRAFVSFIEAMSGALIPEQEYGLGYCIGQGNLNGLYTLVHHYVGHIAVKIRPFSLRWREIYDDSEACLGNCFNLSDTALLGQRVLTNATHIDIRLGPISVGEAMRLRYESPVLSLLKEQINRYLQAEIDCAIEVVVDVGLQQTVLGHIPLRLGLNARL